MSAAQTVFARQEIDATRINETTETADVGFGSFYNHVDNKDAIVTAVTERAPAAAGAAIDAATLHIEDPAEVVAAAHRTLVQIAADDREFGWLMIRLEISHELASAALRGYAARELTGGIEMDRFSVDNAKVALIAAGGARLGITRAVLTEQVTAQVAPDHAAAVLPVFGLSPKDAREVARRPLPQVPIAGPAEEVTESGWDSGMASP